jgi:hypothetical protein
MPNDKKKLNYYWLRRWSLLVRLRDDHVCYVCGERKKDKAQAHHIYPKAVYPDKAYELDNGVTVCSDCHQPIVHSQWTSWLKWTDFFKRWVRRAANRRFNERRQYLVCRRR